MTTRRAIAAVLLCAFSCLLILWMAEECQAGADGGSSDYLQRKGIEGLFSKKTGTDPRSPQRWQKWLGIGAFFVTFAVIKWL